MRDEFQDLVTELAVRRVSRRQFFARAMAMGVGVSSIATALAACGEEGGGAEASPSPSKLDETKPEKLFLFNWEFEIAPANKKKFKAATGIEIVESYYDDNEALLAKLKGGARGYDLCVPTGYMVSILKNSGLLVPLNVDYIPNFENVIPKFQAPHYDPGTDGQKFSVPYLWGTTGIAVRTDKVSEPVTSWAQLWDAKYKGQINMLADERETLGAALKKLGYSLNTQSQEELDAAKNALIDQKPLVRQYDSLDLQRNIIKGVPLCHMWNGNAFDAMTQIGEDKVAYVLPEEGYTIWVDNLCIPIGGPSVYAAHLFMDFICLPENAADLVNYVKYHSPNAAAEPLIDPFVAEHTPSEADLERGEFLDDVGAFGTQYTAAWQEVTAS